VWVLSAEIVETAHFRDLKAHISSGALLVLDIDDTLLIPAQTLGNDAWFQYQYKKKREEKASDPLDAALALWEAIRHLTSVRVVEEGADAVVPEMQEKGVRIMGLTTQGLALASRTANQLRSLHFDLSRTAPSQDDHYFLNGHGVLFRKGILFTSGTDKGKALLKFLGCAGFSPKKIVFLNDKLTHLAEVEKACKEKGIPFVGLRYSYSDERTAAFRPEIAEVQLRYSSFDRILSDEEAERILAEQQADAFASD